MEETREEFLRRVYTEMDGEARADIMNLQVARRDDLAIRVLKELGTKEPLYQDAQRFVRQNFVGPPMWESHRVAGTGLTDID